LPAPEIWLQNVQNVNIFYRDITSRATPERSADFILILMLAKRKKASTKLYFLWAKRMHLPEGRKRSRPSEVIKERPQSISIWPFVIGAELGLDNVGACF
jgi:hypothetical protein